MKKQNDIVITLNKILNDGFCQQSHHRTYQTLKKLKQYITEDEYKTIHKHLLWTDSDNPDVWYGCSGITESAKYEYTLFSEYIKSLISKYEQVKA